MRRSSKLALLCVVGSFVAGTARADGLFYQLPEDGAWALYELEYKSSRDGQEQTIEGSLRMASVGKVQEDGKDARWIEIRLDLAIDGNDASIISKVLIPEEHLKEGASPTEHLIRGWLKQPVADEPVEVGDDNRGPLPAFLAGPLKDQQKLEAVTLKNDALGEIEAGGVSGYTEFSENDNQMKMSFEVRRHEKAPFGVVSAEMKVETSRDGQVVEAGNAKVTLKETGKTALSDLPKHK